MSAPATPPVWNVRIVSCVSGLADRLRGDDADRVADLGERAGCHRAPVAGLAYAAGAPRT